MGRAESWGHWQETADKEQRLGGHRWNSMLGAGAHLNGGALEWRATALKELPRTQLFFQRWSLWQPASP